MSHNLAQLFEAVASSVPERECVVFGSRRLNYSEVQARSRRVANILLRHGLTVRSERSALLPWKSGQAHVGLYLLNGNEYVEATFGSHGARCVPFNVNFRYTPFELASLFDDAGADAIVFHARFAPTLTKALALVDRHPLLIQVADESGHDLLPKALDYETSLAGSSSDLPLVEPSADDLHMLYTGGTTGAPKGTLWRQRDLFDSVLSTITRRLRTDLSSAEAIASATADLAPEIVMPLAPFMHGASYWVVLGALVTGDTLVIQSEVFRLVPSNVWQTVQTEKVRAITLVGEAFLRPLCDEFERTPYDASSLRRIVSGGVATSTLTKQRVLRLFPNAVLLDAGGASESGRQLLQVNRLGDSVVSNVFRPEPGTCVLSEEKTRRLEPGHEGIGWLARSGPLPLGYLNDEAKTKNTFGEADGERMSVPGDRARLLADGSVELLGRESATINSGGEKVFAEEVEQALLRHPAVLDVVVVGRPSERWGQEVVALVSFAEGDSTTDDALIISTSDILARYKQPKHIIRVDSVFRSPAGKPDYAWARAVASQPSEQLASGRPV
jgi:acyl-CoA synthetase (AMP-forming)/AMP-acid ligase II